MDNMVVGKKRGKNDQSSLIANYVRRIRTCSDTCLGFLSLQFQLHDFLEGALKELAF
jgi:hypothetical protein